MPYRLKILVRQLAVVSFLFIFLAPINAFADKQKLTVVADEWPPFSSASMPNFGLSPNIISTALRRAGYEVEVVILPWARIMHGAKNGTYDVVGSLFYATDLLPFMQYGQPYYDTDIRFARKRGTSATFTTLDSLRPYSIAVGDGFLYEENFDNATFLNKVVATTTMQCMQMVAHGRADLTLDSIDVLRYTLKNEIPENQNDIELLPEVLATQSVYMAVTNGVPNADQVVSDFNEALAAMKSDGSYDDIIREHKASIGAQ